MVLLSWIVVACLAVTGCRARADRGAQCVFNDDCSGTLVCASHTCRAQCRDARDCLAMEACVPGGPGGSAVCLPPGQAAPCRRDSDCLAVQPAGTLRCAVDGLCRVECRTDYDCQRFGARSMCSAAGMCTAPDQDASADASMDAADVAGDVATDVTTDLVADAPADAPVSDAPDVSTLRTPPTVRWAIAMNIAGTTYFESRMPGLAVDSAGAVVLAQGFRGTADFGGAPISGPGATNVAVASFTSAGAYRFAEARGGTSNQSATAVALDRMGNAVVVGDFLTATNLGGTMLTSMGRFDGFVAQYSVGATSLTHTWSIRFGTVNDDRALDVAVDDMGNVFVAGTTDDTGSQRSIFVSSLNPMSRPIWSSTFTPVSGARSQSGNAVAVAPDGSVYLAGQLNGSVDFGGGMVSTAGIDGFIAAFTRAGAHRWSRAYGDFFSQTINAAATDGAGNVYVTGIAVGGINFGGGALRNVGMSDGFLAALGPDGSHRWSLSFGGGMTDQGLAVATDSARNVYVCGSFQQTMTIADTMLSASPAGDSDAFVASYTGDGRPRWAVRFGGAGRDFCGAIAVSPTGDVVIGGAFEQLVSFGGTNLNATLGDVFVASLMQH